MPTLEKALANDLTGYTPVVAKPQVNAPTPATDMQPGRNSMQRCPLPILGQATPDALRSYYLSGQVPQTRLLTPQPTATPLTSSTTTTSLITTSAGSSSTATLTLAAAQATITSSVTGPLATFTGVLNLAKSYQLLSLSVNSTARVELYGTSVAQTGDLSRGLDVPLAAGTGQNIICDIVLDTLPYQWAFQSRMGANADNPQTTSAYVSITNLGSTSAAITLTVKYLPLES